METNDFSLVLTKQFDARQYAQTLEDHITQLAKEDGEKVVCLGTLQSARVRGYLLAWFLRHHPFCTLLVPIAQRVKNQPCNVSHSTAVFFASRAQFSANEN